jgi:hypothetical protein
MTPGRGLVQSHPHPTRREERFSEFVHFRMMKGALSVRPTGYKPTGRTHSQQRGANGFLKGKVRRRGKNNECQVGVMRYGVPPILVLGGRGGEQSRKKKEGVFYSFSSWPSSNMTTWGISSWLIS